MAEKLTMAPELIVIAKPGAGLRARAGEPGTMESIAGADVSSLNKLLKNVPVTPLFGVSEDRLQAAAAAEAASTGVQLPDLSVFYKVDVAPEKAADLLAKLRDHEAIEAAYLKPPAEPAQLNTMAPDANDAPPATPDFTARQIYLGAAPGGIEALWAHGRPGGKGNNVRVIDIEGAWRFSHEDLGANQGGVVGGVQNSNIGWRNHGTAVIGVISGDENAIGIKGIAPNANMRAISIFENAAGTAANSAKAIRDAADKLSAGDIILIELHRPGPRHNFASRADQAGYIAIEWWEDDFQAVLYATSKGVIVVEAAGNGQENLDDALYSVRPAGFPAAWTNPFNRANRDSRAIVVGAGAPPPGTHGRDHGPDRSRLAFSNYGALIDAQGWGREVTTCGYGDLQGGANEDLWYTDQFSGTSSASPIVVGAVACTQGNRKARGLAVYTPLQMRQRLRSTGSAQTDAPGRPATQRIGTRPNLRELVGLVIKGKDFKNEKIEIKELKIEKNETKELKVEKVEKIEIKENQKVEFEKFRDFDFKINEGIDIIRGRDVIRPGSASIEDRLSAIEAALGIAAPEITAPADVPQQPAPMICTAFGSMPVGLGPNPRAGNQASFRVFQFNGAPAPNTRIQVIANIRGLDCGFRCEATLANPASSVTLALVHFAQPGVIQALNSSNQVVASANMGPAGQLQSYVLNGAGIRRVVIRCPQDETLLVRFCYRRLIIKIKPEKELKIEKNEQKEIKIEKVEKPEKLEKEKDKNDTKDQKDQKDQQKETKEVKEVKEGGKEGAKEIKETGKEIQKEIQKEKETVKEILKDQKELQKEGSKELKEAGKDLGKEQKEIKEGGKEGKEFEGGPPPPVVSAGSSVEDRLAAIESAFAHFIGAGLRPDLSQGALTGEEDLSAFGSDLDKESADAKNSKDDKDVMEKLTEA